MIFAGAGVDESFGDEGNDRLWALARVDRKGSHDTTGDTLHGGAGDDVFRTRDGEADTVDCGEGDDRAFLDKKDVISDATAENPNGSCEHVQRKRAVSASGSGQERAEGRHGQTQAPRQGPQERRPLGILLHPRVRE